VNSPANRLIGAATHAAPFHSCKYRWLRAPATNSVQIAECFGSFQPCGGSVSTMSPKPEDAVGRKGSRSRAPRSPKVEESRHCSPCSNETALRPARRIGLRAAVPSTRDGRSRLAGRARRSSCLASPGSRTRLCRNHDATVFSICTSSRLTPTERDPRLARFDSEVSIHRGAANPLVGCLRVDVM